MNSYIALVIEKLNQGKHVEYAEGGNSMAPTIKHKEQVLLVPITDENTLKKKDVVFCKVGRSFYTHQIKSIKAIKGKRRYQISNLKGRVNGTIGFNKIFGKVIAIGKEACKAHKAKLFSFNKTV